MNLQITPDLVNLRKRYYILQKKGVKISQVETRTLTNAKNWGTEGG